MQAGVQAAEMQRCRGVRRSGSIFPRTAPAWPSFRDRPGARTRGLWWRVTPRMSGGRVGLGGGGEAAEKEGRRCGAAVAACGQHERSRAHDGEAGTETEEMEGEEVDVMSCIGTIVDGYNYREAVGIVLVNIATPVVMWAGRNAGIPVTR